MQPCDAIDRCSPDVTFKSSFDKTLNIIIT